MDTPKQPFHNSDTRTGNRIRDPERLFQLIGERLAEARGRARSSAKIRQTSEVAWAPLCEAMTAHAAAYGGADAAGIGGVEEWTQALLLLNDCHKAVTISVDRHYLILHRDLLTEYATVSGGVGA